LKTNNITWLRFIAVLTALSLPNKTLAYEQNLSAKNNLINVETRLNKIANILHLRAEKLNEDLPQITNNVNYQEILAGGWVKGASRGFVNNSGGGGFLNNRGWGDGGGFINRRY
jgi:rSAM-associated Gly-rich repeat protein